MSVKSELRPMSEDERERARALLAYEVPNVLGEVATGVVFTVFGLMLGALAGTILIVFAQAALALPFGKWVRHGQATFALVGAAFAAWSIWAPYRARRDKTLPLEEDVLGGVVEVLDVEAFIAWSEFDSVPAFSFDVADEKPLLVRGEALGAAVKAGKFPCRRFTVVRLPATKHALSIEPRGEPLPVRG